jgi:hypothetical protein
MKSCRLGLNLAVDLLHSLVIGLRSRSSFGVANHFLREQLAFYRERRIKPGRTPSQRA